MAERLRTTLRVVRRRLAIAGRLIWEAALTLLEFTWGLISGYGEKPLRVFRAGLSILVVFTILYMAVGGEQLRHPGKALYFSAVSFVALGYGEWVKADGLTWWARGLGVSEALIGVFLIATFAATLRRR